MSEGIAQHLFTYGRNPFSPPSQEPVSPSPIRSLGSVGQRGPGDDRLWHGVRHPVGAVRPDERRRCPRGLREARDRSPAGGSVAVGGERVREALGAQVAPEAVRV